MNEFDKSIIEYLKEEELKYFSNKVNLILSIINKKHINLWTTINFVFKKMHDYSNDYSFKTKLNANPIIV